VKALGLAFLALLALCWATTFPASEELRRQALGSGLFTAAQIETGYTISVQRKLINWAGIFILLLFLSVLGATPRARRLADACFRWAGGRWLPATALVGLFCFICARLLDFPLAILRHEHWRAWGMTRQPFLDWLGDYLKTSALELALTLIILLTFYGLLRLIPRWWWRAAAVLAAAGSVAFFYILPLWVEPLFHTFTPLSRYEKLDEKSRTYLEKSIRRQSEAAGIPVGQILVMDASRQGAHTNAYFTGFGSSRRIVLYDTLLDTNSIRAVESVIGHEIGHWQHQHIVRALALVAVAIYIGLFFLNRILLRLVGRPPLFLTDPADPAGWPGLLLLALLGNFLLLPPQNAISRYFERQADWSALELTQDPEAFIEAERQLGLQNKANLVPNATCVFWFYTHPPTLERIAMARAWTVLHPKGASPK
jgi:STE24 endopeptidase